MALEMECMCLECGISTYLDMEGISMEDLGDGVKIVKDTYCPECGGLLKLIGKAGDEPYYKLG